VKFAHEIYSFINIYRDEISISEWLIVSASHEILNQNEFSNKKRDDKYFNMDGYIVYTQRHGIN